MTHIDDAAGSDDTYSVEESAADELPSDFDDVDDRGQDEHVRLPRRPQLPGESLYDSGLYFILHRPGHFYNRMPAVAAEIKRSHSGLNLVVSQPLPRLGTKVAQAYFDNFAGASGAWRLADPQGYALPGDVIEDPNVSLTDVQKTKVGYVATAPDVNASATDRTNWNRQVTNTQRASGANLLLTPGRTLDTSDPNQSLRRLGQELDDLLNSLGEGEVPVWNVTVQSTWLVDEHLRSQLLGELVDRDDVAAWHLRVYWPLISRTYGQNLDARVLSAYRDLAHVAAREEKVLLLPNTGVTGWLSLMWGTSGFGAGGSSTTQAFAAHPRIAARKGVPRSTVDRYFARPLLHTISVDTHRGLQESLPETTYPPCHCTFCREQADDPVWRRELAAQHAACSFGDMAGRAAEAGNRSEHVVAVARAARTLLGSIPDAYSLSAAEAPEHLDVWAAESFI